jgi:hypothetical protein
MHKDHSPKRLSLEVETVKPLHGDGLDDVNGGAAVPAAPTTACWTHHCGTRALTNGYDCAPRPGNPCSTIAPTTEC